ncbi:ferritin-like protein [Candidatus Albibeggiatoa sp. nov. BB20]|uniref:ferritin-like domain-containing protein n=1 Tax=Candidatus Albibeggiatoa sp. nov. BB20 TaxID=3162723 RepID=UPI0033657887
MSDKVSSPIPSYPHQPLEIHPDLADMLVNIQGGHVTGNQACEHFETLLKAALHLEFATIPIYLSAAFSLTSAKNDPIKKLIIRIAKEEMMHMTVVANLMNAIGMSPNIIDAVPKTFPHTLDMLSEPLEINLESFSCDLVKNVFMRIEAPETNHDYPINMSFAMQSDAAQSEKVVSKPKTIGEFYKGVINIINSDSIPNLFEKAEKNAYKQIKIVKGDMKFKDIGYKKGCPKSNFPLKDGFDLEIKDKESAVRYLEWVIGQGEGASTDNPIDSEGLPGHYYRFESIIKEKYLTDEPYQGSKYSYSGSKLDFDPCGKVDFVKNVKAENYEGDVRIYMDRFNKQYTSMVNNLQKAFNCENSHDKDKAYNYAVDDMNGMRVAAVNIVKEAAKTKIGIPFEYNQHG